MSLRSIVLAAGSGLLLFVSCSAQSSRSGAENAPAVTNPYPSDHGAGGLDAGTPSPTDPGANVTVPNASAPFGPGGGLILYDRSGEWGWLGELYAIQVGGLAGHFGPWTAKPVAEYAAGEMASHTAVVYVGSSFDEPLPVAFLDDVLANTRPVVWIDDNIWQLAKRTPDFGTTYGFAPWVYDNGAFGAVTYKGVDLSRFAGNRSGLMTYSSVGSAQVLAYAIHTGDGQRVPWALRAKNLTYIGENPLAYVSEDDRYLAFCDLLFDAFAPDTAERHRALVRIDDVNGTSDPATLRAIADLLANANVPFSVSVIPEYVDPTGHYGGRPTNSAIADMPAVTDAIEYMVLRGGTLVLHGDTHQYGTEKNPYTAVSGDDFEFFRAHLDGHKVVYDGPVAHDSRAWAAARLKSGLDELARAGLPRPTVFEYPRYAGSVADSLAVRDSFERVYQRGLYFGGTLTGSSLTYGRMISVTYPYVGGDLFGFKIVPESLGEYSPTGWSERVWVVADMLRAAHANHVVRDGFASFYFNPYHPVSVLSELIAGIKAEGYVFASVTDL